ncbi:IS4 family transposase, partial [Acinetobacter sp. c2-A9]
MFIYRLFGLSKVTLSIDRTNWKWGKSNINIFMLGVVYRGIAIPLYWGMLDKRGNTNHLERAELIERFIKQFGKDNIDMILADREFVGERWFNWLTDHHIPFTIR